MLTFSTVNPENFSLIPLYHPENEANFWLPNILKRAMFTLDFRKEGKMQAVSTHEAWNWSYWFSFMCHSQLTTIKNSNFHGKIWEIVCARSNLLNTKHFEGFGLRSATSISKRLISLVNFVHHLTRLILKEGFTTTLVTTQELSISLLLCSKSKARDKTFSTHVFLVTF